MQHLVHYGLHFIAPILIAKAFYKSNWRRPAIIMLLTIVVDFDHLHAYPEIFVPERCSIGFHPLHSYYAILFYFFLLLPSKTRIVAIGLLLHMAADYLDCQWMPY